MKTRDGLRFKGKPHTHSGAVHYEAWGNNAEHIYSLLSCRANSEERYHWHENASRLKMVPLGITTMRGINQSFDSSRGWRQIHLSTLKLINPDRASIIPNGLPRLEDTQAEIDRLWLRICSLLDSTAPSLLEVPPEQRSSGYPVFFADRTGDN